jgi:hypothetical protein
MTDHPKRIANLSKPNDETVTLYADGRDASAFE